MNMDNNEKNVALVLASGGAKGYAHIGAIEALLDEGYTITSIAGTSMGALIGGIYAAGGLEEVKKWMFELNKKQVFSLADFKIGRSGILKGESVIEAMKDIVPDRNIEELDIPFCASATDLNTGSEYVFRTGKLYDAIRASISVPMFFHPVTYKGMKLIDGGITNGLPLNRVARKEEDILVAVNLDNYHHETIFNEEVVPKKKTKSKNKLSGFVENTLENFKSLGNNLSQINDSISILMRTNVNLSLQLNKPDIYVNIDLKNKFGSYNFDHAEEIARIGYEQMLERLKQVQ